ncbi:hypothetical protein [Chitinimonas lacunae]|uniref:DUF2846 domain-containing protein n=1 Tax=Chitinimonas lacunae TaxID=1963018 RepID=A0ABV8MRQ5_9NEIS
MKSYRSLLAGVVLAAVLSGCAMPKFHSVAPVQTLPAPAADRAQIVFINPGQAIHDGLPTTLYEIKAGQREFLGVSAAKTRLVHEVAPGRHRFMSQGMLAPAHFLDAEVEAGKRYYVLLRFVYGNGRQLRPLRNQGDSDYNFNNPKFEVWKRESVVVLRNADADNFYRANEGAIAKAQAAGEAIWNGKNAEQKAQLTLNREDSTER